MNRKKAPLAPEGQTRAQTAAAAEKDLKAQLSRRIAAQSRPGGYTGMWGGDGPAQPVRVMADHPHAASPVLRAATPGAWRELPGRLHVVLRRYADAVSAMNAVKVVDFASGGGGGRPGDCRDGAAVTRIAAAEFVAHAWCICQAAPPLLLPLRSRGARMIDARAVLDAVAIHEKSFRQVCLAHGWSGRPEQRRALIDGLSIVLHRMQ